MWDHWRKVESRWKGSSRVAAQDHGPGMEEWECSSGLAESSDCPNPQERKQNSMRKLPWYQLAAFTWQGVCQCVGEENEDNH